MRSPVRIPRPFVLLAALALSACAATEPADRASAVAADRVGVYDSRAVAVAYYRSPAFATRMRDLVAARDAARAAGDGALAAEIEARGAALQDAAHRQGFGTAPVDDVLASVPEGVAAVRERAGVTGLVSKWDPSASGRVVPATDVTDDLVRLFHPDAATLEVIRQVRAQDPVSEASLRRGD